MQQLLKDPKVSLAVLNPYIKRTVKVKSLNDITKREKFSPLTANLMNLLAENGRLGNTQGIISAFSTIMSVHRGEVPCTVTTASVSSRLLLLHWGRSLSLVTALSASTRKAY